MKHFLINTVASSELLSPRQRLALYGRMGLMAMDDVIIQPRCYFTSPRLDRVAIGSGAYINSHCFFDNEDLIWIGRNTFLACHVKILTCTHDIGDSRKRVGDRCVKKPVRIGKGCWIGAGTTILPGVKVGDGVVIGAGALVNRDCEADGVYVGIPARRVKELSDGRRNISLAARG